ncbi:hypothetical protein [Bdellovibrio bacteriovorus]|uniref:hypothetical protein n=1 Tax=Bdellovibrio bacteriovorus TaxID=959 RepID=UPI0035A6A392
MTRKNLFFLVIAFVVGVSVWIFYVNKGLWETQKAIVQQSTPPRRPATAAQIRMAENTSARARLQVETQNLRERLDVERTRLEAQRSLLQELQSQQTTAASETPAPQYRTQIEEGRDEIQTVIEQLRSYDQLEADINRRAQEALREQSSAAQLARDELDNNIRLQEEQIKQTKEDLFNADNNRFYVNEREARLAELNARLDQQNQQLQAMRDQRMQLSATVLESTQNVQAQKEAELRELNENRSQMREEVRTIREEMGKMQEAQGESLMSEMSMRTQIQDAQRAFNNQSKQVEQLEANLKQKEQELNLLR